jgi:hypothetical protein
VSRRRRANNAARSLSATAAMASEPAAAKTRTPLLPRYRRYPGGIRRQRSHAPASRGTALPDLHTVKPERRRSGRPTEGTQAVSRFRETASPNAEDSAAPPTARRVGRQRVGVCATGGEAYRGDVRRGRWLDSSYKLLYYIKHKTARPPMHPASR